MVWDVLPEQLPWFVVGPGLGLLVVGLYAIANKPLGATGAYLQTVSLVAKRQSSEPWRVAYFVGLLAFGFLLSAGGFTNYDTVHDSLLFRDANVFLVMGSEVLVAMPLLHVLKRRRWVTPLGGPLTITPSGSS